MEKEREARYIYPYTPPHPTRPENVEGNAVMQSERLLSIARLMSRLSVADPGFLRGLDASPPGCANRQFRQIFPKTAWKWKNLGIRGRGVPLFPLDPAMFITVQSVYLRSQQISSFDLFSEETSHQRNIDEASHKENLPHLMRKRVHVG